MSFPEVQSGCKVAPGDTKGFCSREPLRAGRRAEPRQKMAAPAPCGGRLTLRRSEGICHRTPQHRRALGAHRAGEAAGRCLGREGPRK